MYSLNSRAEQEEYIVPTSIQEVRREVNETKKPEPLSVVAGSLTVAKDLIESTTKSNDVIDESCMKFTYDSETDSCSETETQPQRITWKLLNDKYEACYGVPYMNSPNFKQCLLEHCKSKGFKDYCAFLNHMRFTHFEELKLCCDICSQFYEKLELLAAHRFMHGAGDALKLPAVHMCPECGKAYPNSIELSTHIRLLHFYKCLYCKAPFIGRLARNEHMNSSCGKSGKIINLTGTYASPQKESAQVANNMNSSSQNQSTGQQAICILTETTRFGRLVCQKHGDTRNCRGNETTFNIVTVGQPEPKRIKLSKTATEVPVKLDCYVEQPPTKITKVKCDNVEAAKPILKAQVPVKLKCLKEQPKNKSAVQDRIKAARLKERASFALKLKTKLIHCPKCPKAFADDEKIQLHLMTHMDSKIHRCKMCSQEFSNFYALKHHMESHDQEYPFACPKCYQRFRMKTTWMVHIGNHKKPLICPVCTKGFQKISSMTGHMMVYHL